MSSIEIVWRTPLGDHCTVVVSAEIDGVALSMGGGSHVLRVPATSARLLAQALIDAATPAPAAPPPSLYHEPEEESRV